ncbi:MAG: ABC transporter permease subunit, partial [Nitriliruptorales bacterium]|nr:ABC transporter permease subunit [Nitriliruptorales bacterium]
TASQFDIDISFEGSIIIRALNRYFLHPGRLAACAVAFILAYAVVVVFWLSDGYESVDFTAFWAASWLALNHAAGAVFQTAEIAQAHAVVFPDGGYVYRWLYPPIAGLGGVLYTIPSLAAFALLWPLLGGLRGRFATAVIALTSYTILILVRNIVTGIDNVPEDVKEAADGMGYRPVRRFLQIELPLALPSIVAGVRIATVTVIGLVTVTALLGLGGFGALILDGIRRGPLPTLVVVGILGSVILATLVDFLLLRLERLLTPWSREAAT